MNLPPIEVEELNSTNNEGWRYTDHSLVGGCCQYLTCITCNLVQNVMIKGLHRIEIHMIRFVSKRMLRLLQLE